MILIAGLIGVALSLLVGFVFANLPVILVIIGLLWLLGKCDCPSDSQAIAAFPTHKVAVKDVVAQRLPGSRWVSSISATVVNSSPARIYDLRLHCTFHLSNDSERLSRATTYYHLGYINPLAAEQVTLRIEGNGYLSEADPVSFTCEPWYEYEQADVYRAINQSHRDLRAQVDVTLASMVMPSRVRSEKLAVRVEGQMTNGAPWPVVSVTVSCRVMRDMWGNTENISRTLAVAADPGEAVAITGQIGEVQPLDPKTGLQGHHCRVSGIRRSHP